MICDLCKKEINTETERYVHVEDWDRKVRVKEIWCHLQCFNKSMNRELKETEKKAKDMLERAGRIFESQNFEELFPKKEEEYIIK